MSLSTSQHSAIMREYEQKQLLANERMMQRYENAYLKIPQLRELDNQISTFGIEQAKKQVLESTSSLASIKSEFRSLLKTKTQLLLSHGFPMDYLQPQFECPLCSDTGYVNNQKCTCFKKLFTEILYGDSALKRILDIENFNTFSLNYYSDNHIDSVTKLSSRKNAQKALDTCLNFVKSFPNAHENLLLYGDSGVGKTFLSHCIAKELIEKTYSVIYFSAFEFFEILKQNVFERSSEGKEYAKYIFDCDLLIIDDLGTELSNSFTTSQLFLCVNERLIHQKSTIISTNLSLATLIDTYYERTISRITSNYTLLRLTGDDIRLQKKFMRED